MRMPHETAVLNPELQQTLVDLRNLVHQAAGTAPAPPYLSARRDPGQWRFASV